jgi:hypothetical protein
MTFSINDLIQFSIFLVSFSVFARKPVPPYLQLFPVYFFLLMLGNITIEYTTPLGIHNTIIQNISGIGEFFFYFYVIRTVVVNRKVKNGIFYTSIAFTVFALINLFFIQKDDRFNPINFTIGTILSVSFCIYYFFELFQKTETHSLRKITGFWIVSGIFFNVVLSFPMYASISFMDNMSRVNKQNMIIIFNHIEAIYNIMNTFTYILYTIGFLSRIRYSPSNS